MAPNQFDIIVDIITTGNLVVTDIDHKIMLQVKSCDTSFHQQRVLVDADGKPIVLMRGKVTLSSIFNIFLSVSLKI